MRCAECNTCMARSAVRLAGLPLPTTTFRLDSISPPTTTVGLGMPPPANHHGCLVDGVWLGTVAAKCADPSQSWARPGIHVHVHGRTHARTFPTACRPEGLHPRSQKPPPQPKTAPLQRHLRDGRTRHRRPSSTDTTRPWRFVQRSAGARPSPSRRHHRRGPST
jgi:hypothetical protein